MKYIKQITIIAIFSLLGEICNRALPLPVPASVYGMIFLLIALLLGIVKVSHIQETADFLLEIMPLFFVGPFVRLMDQYEVFKDSLVSLVIICVVSTLVAMLCTGLVSQLVIRLLGKGEGRRDD